MKLNKKIILSGGGDIKTSLKIDREYFSLLSSGSKILYIPLALDRDMTGFESCYDWFSKLISEHSNRKDIDFTMLLENDSIPDFEIYDSIYIGGGNTFKLLKYIYKNNIDKSLKKYIQNGGIFYGGSAGAMILGYDIRTVEEENDKSYSQFLGLNLLGENSIICHYVLSLDKKIFESVKKINSKIIALPEDSGLVLDSNGNILKTIGDIFIFDKNKKAKI